MSQQELKPKIMLWQQPPRTVLVHGFGRYESLEQWAGVFGITLEEARKAMEAGEFNGRPLRWEAP